MASGGNNGLRFYGVIDSRDDSRAPYDYVRMKLGA